MPPSSLYCCHASVSMISAADKNRKMSASPWLRMPSADAVVRLLNIQAPPSAPAPTATDLPKKDLRLIPPFDFTDRSSVFCLEFELCLLVELVAFMPNDRQQRG